MPDTKSFSSKFWWESYIYETNIKIKNFKKEIYDKQAELNFSQKNKLMNSIMTVDKDLSYFYKEFIHTSGSLSTSTHYINYCRECHSKTEFNCKNIEILLENSEKIEETEKRNKINPGRYVAIQI